MMKKIPHKLLSCASLFAAALVPASLLGESSHQVNIEEIRDLKLSGFGDDDGGELKWRLEAASAEAASRSKAEDIRRTSWNLKDLRLLTFGSQGEVFAKMTSALGVFNPERREAESAEKVSVDGDGFSVRGKGWSWRGEGHENLIRVNDDVFVSLELPDGDETLSVMADALLIRGEDERTTLVFSGGVVVLYGETTMNCDALEILVLGDGAEAAGFEEEKKSGGSGLKDKIMRIGGNGNVRVERAGKILTGDSAEFFPGEERFFVRENVRLTDAAGTLSVSGDVAEGKVDARVVEIVATKPRAELRDEGAPVAVSVRMPSMLGKDGNAASRGGDAPPAKVRSRRIVVEAFPDRNVVSFFDEVNFSDAGIRIAADRFVAETDPDAEGSLLLDVPSEDSARREIRVRSAVAEGNVRAEHDGRILTCGRADLFPQQDLVRLTGEPKVDVPEEKFSLTGDRADIFSARDQIDVYSAEGDDPARRRVSATLPAVSELAGAAAEKSGADATTEIVGDRLRLTRSAPGENCVDVFGNVVLRSRMTSGNLDGSCDRLIVFADAADDAGTSGASAGAASRIRKIIADGNVELEQNGYELSGGRAEITPSVRLREWRKEDRSADDGGNDPFVVVVDPGENGGARPRITFSSDAAGGVSPLSFARGDSAAEENSGVPASGEKSSSAPEKTTLESDRMELIAGEKTRARFFLRGNVDFRTEGGASGRCDEVEGLLAPPAEAADAAEAPRFEAKEVVCRGNIRFEQDGGKGRGSVLEIFPQEDRAVLSGDAAFRDKDGTELYPGNDRFVFDLEKKQLITGEAADAAGGGVPAQVARPQIIIPKGSRNVFVIPKSVSGDSEEK